MISTLHIHVLGDFLLVSGDTPVTTVDIPRLQSLLAYLLLHRAAPQSRAHLAFLLWPDSTEEQAHTNLRKVLYHLRQTFPHADSFLHIGRQSLSWQPQTATLHLICPSHEPTRRQRRSDERAVRECATGETRPAAARRWSAVALPAGQERSGAPARPIESAE